MFVVIVERVVKVNTSASEKFSPRTANRTSKHVCGPFRTAGTAQKAVLAALSTHTALSASVWSAEQIAEKQTNRGRLSSENQNLFAEAARVLDSVAAKVSV